jgi:hypothetical protein
MKFLQAPTYRLEKMVKPKNGKQYSHISFSVVNMPTGEYPDAMGAPYSVVDCRETVFAEIDRTELEPIASWDTDGFCFQANQRDLGPELTHRVPMAIQVNLSASTSRIYELDEQSSVFLSYTCVTDPRYGLILWNK